MIIEVNKYEKIEIETTKENCEIKNDIKSFEISDKEELLNKKLMHKASLVLKKNDNNKELLEKIQNSKIEAIACYKSLTNDEYFEIVVDKYNYQNDDENLIIEAYSDYLMFFDDINSVYTLDTMIANYLNNADPLKIKEEDEDFDYWDIGYYQAACKLYNNNNISKQEFQNELYEILEEEFGQCTDDNKKALFEVADKVYDDYLKSISK